MIIMRGRANSFGSLRIESSSTSPLITGMFQSDRIRVIGWRARIFIASAPLAASMILMATSCLSWLMVT
jgi:hypothetical protein